MYLVQSNASFRILHSTMNAILSCSPRKFSCISMVCIIRLRWNGNCWWCVAWTMFFCWIQKYFFDRLVFFVFFFPTLLVYSVVMQTPWKKENRLLWSRIILVFMRNSKPSTVEVKFSKSLKIFLSCDMFSFEIQLNAEEYGWLLWYCSGNTEIWRRFFFLFPCWL